MKFAGWCLLAVLLGLAGCGKFLPPLTNTNGRGTGATGAYFYVANSNPNLRTVAGFGLANGALTSTSGSPYASPLTPNCMAMTPDNALLYVGSVAGAIYVYTVGSDGALTLGHGGTPVFTGGSPAALEVDPSGKWLLGISAFSGEAYVFGIDSSTGALTNASTSGVGLASTSASGLAITPNEAYVYVALGTGGVETLSFNSATGALVPVNSVLAPKQNLDADLAVAASPDGE